MVEESFINEIILMLFRLSWKRHPLLLQGSGGTWDVEELDEKMYFERFLMCFVIG